MATILNFANNLKIVFGVPKYFWLNIWPKKSILKKKNLGRKGGGGGIYYSKNDGFLEWAKNLYKVSSYLEVKMY